MRSFVVPDSLIHKYTANKIFLFENVALKIRDPGLTMDDVLMEDDRHRMGKSSTRK